jgi:adenine phosphoribosyltransferase
MSSAKPDLAEIASAIRNIPDFPRPGIQFKDITPVLADARLFAASLDYLLADLPPGGVGLVAGIEARGFIFGAAAAVKLGVGFIPIRKKGKLPYQTVEETYDLEYGSSAVAIHVDAVQPGTRVLLVDDLLATGGTAAAAARLLGRLGSELVGVHFLVELAFLKGREKLAGLPVRSLIVFQS